MQNHLTLSWSTSRGQDTYGYNICRLDDNKTGKRYRCMGGGYDMRATVIGKYLQDVFQAELSQLVESRKAELVDCGYGVKGWRKLPDLYGMTISPAGKIYLDGACGDSCMVDIAAAIGIRITTDYNRRTDRTVGYFVSSI